MPAITIRLKENIHQKAQFLAKHDCRTLSGLIRHLLLIEIRAFEHQHGEIVLSKEEE